MGPSRAMALTQVSLEARQPAIPLGLVGGEPGLDLYQWFGLQLVQALTARPPDSEEPGAGQDVEVLGGSLAGHVQRLSHLGDGKGALHPESIQNRPSRRVRQSLEDVVHGDLNMQP